MKLMFAGRSFGFSLLVVGFCIVATSTTKATELAASQLVLPKSADVRLLDVPAADGVLPVGLVLGVRQMNGDRLHVGRGEILRTDVVSMDEAVAYFTQQINLRPTPFAYVSRSRALLQRGAVAEARRDCESALALDSDYAPAHCQLGRTLTAMQLYNRALQSLRRAVALDEKSGFYYCTLAQTHQAMGSTYAAHDDFTRAIELDDQLLSAYYGRGTVRVDMGEEDAALADFAIVLTRYPAHYYSLNERANIWMRRGEWQSAYNDYTAAIQISRRPELYVNRARALQNLGRHAEAVADCDEAIRLDPKLGAAYRQRAASQTKVGGRFAA